MTSKGFKIDAFAVKKDFHVCEILKGIAQSNHTKSVLFKGGTSLAKAHKIVDRFSEDIDFCVIPSPEKTIGDMTKTMKDVTTFIGTLYPCVKEKSVHHADHYKTSYRYQNEDDEKSSSYIKGVIEVEITTESPTAIIPFEQKEIASYVYEALLETNQTAVIEKYGLALVSLLVAKPEKTLCDKLSRLTKRANEENPERRIAKIIRDLYDIHYLLNDKEIQKVIQTPQFVDLYNETILQEGITRSKYVPRLMNSGFFQNPNEITPKLQEDYDKLLERMVFCNPPTLSQIAETFRKNTDVFERLDKSRPKKFVIKKFNNHTKDFEEVAQLNDEPDFRGKKTSSVVDLNFEETELTDFQKQHIKLGRPYIFNKIRFDDNTYGTLIVQLTEDGKSIAKTKLKKSQKVQKDAVQLQKKVPTVTTKPKKKVIGM